MFANAVLRLCGLHNSTVVAGYSRIGQVYFKIMDRSSEQRRCLTFVQRSSMKTSCADT